MKINRIITTLTAIALLSSASIEAAYRQVVPSSAFGSLPSADFRPVAGDDTSALNRLIKKQSEKTTRVGNKTYKGGVIRIKRGAYLFQGVKLQSNVYIRFDSGVTVTNVTNKGGASFLLDGGIENVSIIGPATFNVRVGGIVRFRAFACRNVDNFEVRNFTVNDRRSTFCAMVFGPGKNKSGPVPRNGTVSGLRVKKAAGGYGAIQMRAGKNVNFSNLDCEGGATLRLESGGETAGMQNIRGSDIENTQGRAAVLFSPHTIRTHRGITLNNLRSRSSSSTVQMISGFGSTKGIFSNVTITDVDAVFGLTRAQNRPSGFPYIPRSLFAGLDTSGLRSGDTMYGPSIAPVLNLAKNYNINVPDNQITSSGFSAQPKKVVKVADKSLTRSQKQTLMARFRRDNQEPR